MIYTPETVSEVVNSLGAYLQTLYFGCVAEHYSSPSKKKSCTDPRYV